MFEVKLILKAGGEVEKRIVSFFESTGFKNLSAFSEVLVFRDNGEEQDCGKMWRALDRIKDEPNLERMIAGGTWKYGEKIESLMGDFFDDYDLELPDERKIF